MILDGHDPAAVTAAAQALRAGALVGLPTETVYGLGADAGSDTAVAQVYAAKGRPADHPLIVHVADPGDAEVFAREIPGFARQLMQAFWPGPLTLILPRRDGVGTAAAGGQDSIGLRCPSHPVAQALLRACRALGVAGVAAPSANRFGRVSPTTAAHVQSELGPDLLVLDGGACEVGIESTIIDCTRGVPVLLRPGQITRDQVQAACGLKLLDPQALAAPAPRASGTLESHYAPQARVRLLTATELQLALDALAPVPSPMSSNSPSVAVYSRTPVRLPGAAVWCAMPPQASAVAHELFAVLRELDALGVAQIWVETPPAGADWEGVRDRLARAAA